jgi:thiol-disulfide isomerase/thioredoxin
MNKTAGIAIFSLGLLQGCGGNEPADAPAPPATPAVTITALTPSAGDATATMFQTLDGQPLELSAFAGKKVFLNYWATWCAPCIREIPAISRAAALLEPENYVFLLASDETLDTINDFLLERDFSGNFIKLNGFFGGHGIHAVPSSVLYDENGNLLTTWAGAFEWDSPEMLAEIRAGQ